MDFKTGDLLELKSVKTLWRVVEENSDVTPSATNPRRGPIIAVVREDWVDKTLPVFMYSKDFIKVPTKRKNNGKDR